MLPAQITQEREGLEVGTLERLFAYRPAPRIFRSGMINYDVAVDGKKFLLDVAADANTRPITLVNNWRGLVEGE
jgi:hypothetical protein